MQTRTIFDNPLDRAVPLGLLGSVSDATLGSDDDDEGSTGSGRRYASSAIMSFGSGSGSGSASDSSRESSMAFRDPYMIIEFIENGLLSDFIDKVAKHIRGPERDTERNRALRDVLPNRILWGFFFCRKSLMLFIADPFINQS